MGSITNSIIDGFQLTGDISFVDLFLSILLAFAVGTIIMYIYKRTFMGVVYVKSFGVSLIMLSMVTSVIILTISSNLMLSLGMVGALSIVRFRTAVKDPMDTVFMFWAIGEGISIGAKLYSVALITTIIISIVMLVMSTMRTKKSLPYILVVRYDEGVRQEVNALVSKLPKASVKSKTVSRGVVEVTFEVNLKDNELNAVERIASINGVYDASLVSYNGDAIA